MSDTSPSIPVRELLEHSTWVRDLARRLARDPAAAEDVAQSTWLAALENPPAEGRPLRQWLGTVVRNFARQSRRGESRRAEREAHAARASSVPSTGDMLERASMQRVVVKAVMGLDEPYRTTILLRFFEELPPREIARRTGVPVETVRTRVGRGLARLRKQLDGEYGGDGRTWLAALLPLTERPWGSLVVTTAPTAPTAMGAVLVNAKLIATVLAVSAVGVGAWLALDSGAAPAEPVLSAAPPAEETDPVAPALDVTAQEPAVRTVPAAPDRAAAPETASAPAAVPESALVRGVVLDANGRGLAGVGVSFSAPGTEAEVQHARSTGGGEFTFESDAEYAHLRADDEQHTSVYAADYRRESQSPPVVIAAPRIELAGTVVDETGAPLAGARVSVALPENFRTRLDVVLDNARMLSWNAESDAAGAFELDEAPFVDGATFRAEAEGYVPYEAPLGPRSDAAMLVRLARPAAAEGLVRGIVVDAAGTPVEGARVALGVDTTVTGADGAFAFLLDDPDSFGARFGFPADALTAIKPGHLPARWTPPTEAGEPRWPEHVRLVLSGEAFTLAGRVVDHLGEAVPEARVWVSDTELFGAVDGRPTQLENLLAGSQSSFWYFVNADAEGRFLIEGLTDRAYSVRAMDTATLLMADAGPFAAGTQDVEIALATDELYPLVAGHVYSHSGDPIAGASVFPMCDAHRARAPESMGGGVIGTSHESLDGVVTDGEGYFEIHNVPRSLVYLRIEGESILPLEYGRDYDPSDPRFEGRPRGLPEDEIESLEIAVEQRCHLVVELSDPAAADQLGVVTAEGRPLTLNVMTATGRRDGPLLPIVDGRSHTMAVPDIGRTLVLYKAGEEVGRMPISLRPGEVTSVTF